MANKDVVLFTRPGCVYCVTLKRGLAKRKVSYTERNIWDDPQAASFVRSVANGNETVPTVTVGTAALVNPSARTVAKLARD